MRELQTIKKLILNGDAHQSIALAISFIRHINASNYYDLDVTDIEMALINKVNDTDTISFEVEIEVCGDILFVISEGYATGGHTRLMENLSQMIARQPTVLITRPTEKSVITRFEKYFGKIITCFKDKDNNDIEYIGNLAKELVKYRKLILNTHPDDIHTIIACGIAKKINKNIMVYFVNHADHIATYGVTVSDVWYEISLCGQQLDKYRGMLPDTRISFLGIPINKLKSGFFEKVNYSYDINKNRFLTAASSNKYGLCDNTTMVPLLDKILTMDVNNKVSIISSGIQLNPFFQRLKRKYPNKVKFYSSLPYDDYIKLTKDTDFYIDSFPMTGGTAFVEQFLNGKPCIGLQTNFYGYTPLDIMKRGTVDEVMELLTSPPTDKFLNELKLKVFEVHSFDKVRERFVNSLYSSIAYRNPMEFYIDMREVKKKKNINLSWDLIKATFDLSKTTSVRLIFSKSFLNFIMERVKCFRVVLLVRSYLEFV